MLQPPLLVFLLCHSCSFATKVIASLQNYDNFLHLSTLYRGIFNYLASCLVSVSVSPAQAAQYTNPTLVEISQRDSEYNSNCDEHVVFKAGVKFECLVDATCPHPSPCTPKKNSQVGSLEHSQI